LVALLTNDTEPELGPLIDGANLIVMDWLVPAAIANGRVKPVALKTPPVKFAADTVTEVEPVFESVTVWLAGLVVKTFPNEMLVGETLSNCVAAELTVTVADADFVLSATLVAFTVNVPVAAGAV
jgi:hypothetical protein